MAKIKMPKGTPTIDMTPMVDLAFLLVTFFMLAANFRSNEPVDVNIPSSIGDEEVPEKTLILVTVDKGGRLFFNVTGDSTVRKSVFSQMVKKYNAKVDNSHLEEYLKITSIGCSMAELPAYLSTDGEGRKKFQTLGIPADSTNNQLKDWIYFADIAMREYGKTAFLKAKDEAKPNEVVNPKDFLPKYVLKVEGQAEYVRAKMAIETFRDLNLNNLHFVTSLENKQ
jgi:biopolymer transport protein ExbD